MKDTMLNKLVIIGVGLIGGSFALALRKAGLVRHITGLGRSKENLQHALELGILDEATDNYSQALEKADLVLIATPVGQTARILGQINPNLEPQTIISDVGSTKQDVIAAAHSLIPGHFQNFVPAHPIAGAELSGATAANVDLFRNKNVILTPSDETDTSAIECIKKLWQGCGARISLMQPYQHDEVLAMMSHLPHILAFALMNHMLLTCTEENSDDFLNSVGGGFRDFARIAGSSPEMWKDICLANRKLLLKQINNYQDELTRMSEMLENNDGAALENSFLSAQKTQRKFLKDKY